MKLNSVIRNIQLVGVIFILVGTVLAFGFELNEMYKVKRVTLADLLLMFIYIEVIGMIGVFWASKTIRITYPVLIAITALSRFIILQGKQMDASQLLYESIAIVLIALAIVVLRLRHSDKLGLSKKKRRK